MQHHWPFVKILMLKKDNWSFPFSWILYSHVYVLVFILVDLTLEKLWNYSGLEVLSSLHFCSHSTCWLEQKIIIFHSRIFSHTDLLSETPFVILGTSCPISLGLWKCSHLVFVPLKFWGRQVLLWLFLFCSLTLRGLSARKKPQNLPKWLCKHSPISYNDRTPSGGCPWAVWASEGEVSWCFSDQVGSLYQHTSWPPFLSVLHW